MERSAMWSKMSNGTDEANTPFAHHSAWWTPLAFVAVVLVTLTATPVLTNFQVRKLRGQLTDGSDAGRVIVNDLEAAFTRQLLVQERGRKGLRDSTGAAQRATNNSLALARELKDEVELDSVARRIGPDAVERFVELRTLARSWHASLNAANAVVATTTLNGRSASESDSQARDDLDAKAEDVLTSAQLMDDYPVS